MTYIYSPSLALRKTRIGFHYFPDLQHYTQKDLERWVPILNNLGASWIVLQSSTKYAVPESFVSGLFDAGIEPIVQFDSLLSFPPTAQEISPILTAYGKWGIHAVLLFDRPNSRATWSSSGLIQQGLVDRFLDRFLPLVDVAIQSGLNPVFPPLEPGGSYWDTAFLRSALESLLRRKRQDYLKNLVLSAYAWTGNHSLNWGIGGPERWPTAKAYQDSPDLPDQRGFRIYDWYQSIARTVLDTPCQVLLLQAGIPHPGNQFLSTQQHTQINLAIARLLEGEKTVDPGNPLETLAPIPEQVVSSNYWLLTATANSPHLKEAWYPEQGEPLPIAQNLKNWRGNARKKISMSESAFPVQKDHSQASTINGSSPVIDHYLLLPTREADIAEWEWNAILQYMRRNHPTVGFSIEEAYQAARITVVGDEKAFPEETLDRLRQSGSFVERIGRSGTLLATLLAER